MSFGRMTPATRATDVTPNDSTELAPVPAALWVGTKGAVAVEMENGGTVTFIGAEGVLPIRVRKVLSSGTTASGIIALY